MIKSHLLRKMLRMMGLFKLIGYAVVQRKQLLRYYHCRDPQSSQLLNYNNYGWLGNPNVAHKDIETCFKEVYELYSIDLDNVYIGGFSGNAITAMDVALNNSISVKGFIFLCPVLIPQSFTKKKMKAVLMEGELELPVENDKYMKNIFDISNFKYQYIINPLIDMKFLETLINKL